MGPRPQRHIDHNESPSSASKTPTLCTFAHPKARGAFRTSSEAICARLQARCHLDKESFPSVSNFPLTIGSNKDS